MVSNIDQIWASIERWLRERTPAALGSQRAGATESEIADMERSIGMTVPEDFHRSLKLHNPGGFVHGFDLLKVEDICARWSEMNALMATGKFDDWVASDATGEYFTPKWWDKRWLPIAEFQGGTLVCLDMGPGPKGCVGQVLRLELADDGPSRTSARSYEEWLKQFLDALVCGEYRADKAGDIEHV